MQHPHESTVQEPTLQEILADPITRSVMRSDGVERGFVEELALRTASSLRDARGRTR